MQELVKVEKVSNGQLNITLLGTDFDVAKGVHAAIKSYSEMHGCTFEEAVNYLEKIEAATNVAQGKPSKRPVAKMYKSLEEERFFVQLNGDDFDEKVKSAQLLLQSISESENVDFNDVISIVEEINDDMRDSEAGEKIKC